MDSERANRCDQEIDRYLHLLRKLIIERGWTQLEVQAELGWGRTYLSQLITRTKTLRVDQVVNILDVIGVSSADFFAKLHGLSKSAPIPLNDNQETQALRVELDHIQALVRGLVTHLESSGHLDAADLAAAVDRRYRLGENPHTTN